MDDLKKQAEAVLFAAGDRIELSEIARLCKTSPNNVKNALNELKKSYKNNDSGLMVVDDGNFWKITVREAYIPLVQQINPRTELDRTTIETLAVIAWKSPILQSDVIKTRTNKAYDHIKELVDSGFLVKERYGRSYMLRLSKKFFDYFDLSDKEDIKKRFKDFVDINEEELIKLEKKKIKEEHEKQDIDDDILRETQKQLEIQQEQSTESKSENLSDEVK
ncbi:MAG: SMC-Scp complex subunit ScpB [Candidatus Nanoarchaeia archaeon]|nr:SMC-Scp complex subunit ScpB [Candidatus Nanoarchaeia archaeon]